MDAKEKAFYLTLLVSMIVLGLILSYLLLSLYRMHKRYVTLNLMLVNSEMSIMENEREQISADLHDELGTALTGVKYMIESLEVEDEKQANTLNRTVEHLQDIIRRTAEIATGLIPPSLSNGSLKSALQKFLDHFESNPHFQVKLLWDEIPLQVETCQHLYRIIQEVIHNTIRHAQASLLTIKVEKRGRFLHIDCRDNGKGFDEKKVIKANRGLGLHNLFRRTSILKGKMSLETAPGKGTRLYFEIPISH